MESSGAILLGRARLPRWGTAGPSHREARGTLDKVTDVGTGVPDRHRGQLVHEGMRLGTRMSKNDLRALFNIIHHSREKQVDKGQKASARYSAVIATNFNFSGKIRKGQKVVS